MHSRNGSYARIVDAMSKRSNDKGHAASPANSNHAPSPSSSKPSFESSKSKTLQAKAHKAAQQSSQGFAPTPDRAPQPRGMGELGVNWQAHIKRSDLQRDKIKSLKKAAPKPPAHLLEKAKKAARDSRAASLAFDKSASR